jgi:hypothetical protein
MGKGSRPAKAKNLVLVPGTGAGVEEPSGSPPVGGGDVPPVMGTEFEAVVEEQPGGVPAAQLAAEPLEDEPPGYPTHLDAGVVADPGTPDDVLATLNHLVLEDAVDEEQFRQLYLHYFAHLGATPGAAHQHWEALKAKQTAEREAARELAERMQAAIADVQPWNPHEHKLRAQVEVNEIRVVFNAAVNKAAPEAAKRHRTVASDLKDRIAIELSQRSGLGYQSANEFLSAWAHTSNDHNAKSIALQIAAAEKFGLQPPGYVAERAAELQSATGFSQTREEAGRFLDAMYERTQDWLSSRGIKELVLFRGMTSSIGSDTAPVDAAHEPVQASVHLNPLNSWTASYDTTSVFSGSGSGYVLTARVPASKVVGCCFTGLGCLSEQEFVVVGGANQQVMAVANENVSYDHLRGTTWKS